MTQTAVCMDTELRKLRPAELYILGQILNVSDSWKKLMAIIPKEGSNIPRFNMDHFSIVEQAVQQQRRSAAEIFLEEWGTMGKNRPTLRTLLDLLVKAQLFRAADYVAGDILKGELPKRPECGPAAPVDISDEAIQKLLEERAELHDTDFDESLIIGTTSELNINKIVYPPDIMVDAANQSSLEGNMQSTKLISRKEQLEEKSLEETNTQQKYLEMIPKEVVSDLMKFSTDEHNVEDCRSQNEMLNGQASSPEKLEDSPNMLNQNADFLPAYIYKPQEMASQELPAFLNDFKKSMEQTQMNEEMKSDDLPICLNDSTIIWNSSYQNSASTSDSLDASNFSCNKNEMISTDLPQCVVELASNSRNKENSIENVGEIANDVKSTLTSRELPITVLEYNR